MREAGRVECRADGADHAVEHAAGGDHVGAGTDVADTLGRQVRQRRVIVEVEPAGLLRKHSTMSVIGVLAETFVGQQERPVVEFILQRPQCLLNDSALFQSDRSGRVLVRRNTEEDERLDAEIEGAADLFEQPIDAELEVARHRGDFFLDAAAGPDEERQDEVVRRQGRLPHHRADEGIVPQAARAVERKRAHGKQVIRSERKERRHCPYASNPQHSMNVPNRPDCDGAPHRVHVV